MPTDLADSIAALMPRARRELTVFSHARRRMLKIEQTWPWPWAGAVVEAWERLGAIPTPM